MTNLRSSLETVNQGRRGFLRGMAGILAAGVAPAAIGSSILMPVRKLWTPEELFVGFVQSGTGSMMWLKLTIEDNLGRVFEQSFNPPIQVERGSNVIATIPSGQRLIDVRCEWTRERS